MSSTLTCIRNENIYDCRLIVDGKRTNNWKVKDIEIISEEGKEISSEIEDTINSFIATTDEYFNCNDKNNKLTCYGSVTNKIISKKQHTFWYKLFGE